MTVCDFDGCTQHIRASGLCRGHYQQRWKGKPLTPIRPVPRTTRERFEQKVNKGPHCWQWVGSKTAQGYGEMRIGGKLVPAHRVSHELHIGPIPDGLVVDHRCHNKACVNPSHLRAVSYKANAENRSGARLGSKSGEWGVSWHKASQKWCVRVRHHSKLHYGGYYADINEAAEAAKALRLSLFQFNDQDRKAA